MEPDYDILCTICGNQKVHTTSTFVCIHTFCQKCLVLWYKKCRTEEREPTCPLCRKVDNIWGTR